MSAVSVGLPVLEHTVSVVIPVYAGERTLTGVVSDVEPLVHGAITARGHRFRVSEVILVHDCGRDDSPSVMRALAGRHDFVRPVWLSRNYGQHAATMAGMASSGGDWIVTMDEDGQHDASYVGAMLDVAMENRVQLVYASPTNTRPHGVGRNMASAGARWLIGVLTGGEASNYHSFRLMLGEIGRGVAAYAGAGVYLDVALGWIAGSVATCP